MSRSIAVVLSFCALAASPALGALLVNEDFTHPDGNLVGQTPTPGPGATWAAHSGGGALPVQVLSGQITLAQGAGSREDVNAGTGATMGAGDKWYSAFDLTVPTVTGAITDVYFAMFLTGTSNFDARIWLTAPTASGFRLAISNDNSITDLDGEVRTGDLAFDTKYRVVTVYDYTAMSGKLWINPVLESDPSFDPTDPGFSDAAVAYAFRQAAGNSTQVIDNLMVGTTFGDVVPEPTTLALLAAAGMMFWHRRR
jgi:hypothetical protein